MKKTKTKRGKRKRTNIVNSVNKDSDKWSILHSNIRHFDSKKLSLEAILKDKSVSVLSLNETHLLE